MTSRPRTPRIVAIGGGGFGSTGRDHALDAYIAELAGPDRPLICLLPTASGDPKEQIARFNATFRRLGCSPSHLALFRLGEQPEVEVREHLLAQDAIYVGGGSLANLLAIWRTHGLDEVLREAWEAGILLCGVSAGSMCWFQAGVTRSHGEPRPTRGLGFLEGSNCVHYANDAARRPAYHAAMLAGALPGGWGVPDGTALVFEATRLVEAVTARPGADAYRVDLVDGEVVETVCRARVLEDRDPEQLEPDPALAEFRAQRRRASDLAGGSRVAAWRHAGADAAEVRRAGRG